MTQISRAIADTGHPARRGQAYVFTSLVPYLTAPAWWLHSVATAYETIKYLQALVMALAIFPAYGIARFVVSRPWALFAGVATIAAPALSYAPILVEEPFAYPVATLALYLIVRAVARPSWRTLALAAAGCILAVATRSQLVALAGAFGLCLLALGWRTERMERWRTTWTRYDWVGAGLLAVGLVLAFSAYMGRHSLEWQTTTALWKGRILDYGVWAAGALAIGSGILPLIATLAVLLRPRTDWRDPGLRAFGIVTAVGIRLVLLVRGGEGGLSVDDLLEPRRGAEPDLSLPVALHRHRRPLRAARRTMVGRPPGRPSSFCTSSLRRRRDSTSSRTTRRTASRSSPSSTASSAGPRVGSTRR